MEMTQEQLDELIKQAKEEAKKGLFTEDDVKRKVTAEVDRRVESGIKTGVETQKEKWLREHEEIARMSAEELAQKQIAEKLSVLSEKEKEISRKANRSDARDMLSEAQIPKSHYEKFLDLLVSDDTEKTISNVKNFINVFNETKSEIETKVKSEFSTVSKPKTATNSGTVTKEEFVKMAFAEKIKFKAEYPELYKEYIK